MKALSLINWREVGLISLALIGLGLTLWRLEWLKRREEQDEPPVLETDDDVVSLEEFYASHRENS